MLSELEIDLKWTLIEKGFNVESRYIPILDQNWNERLEKKILPHVRSSVVPSKGGLISEGIFT